VIKIFRFKGESPKEPPPFSPQSGFSSSLKKTPKPWQYAGEVDESMMGSRRVIVSVEIVF